jgi:Ribbon-helix-helix protein, copG family
MKTRLNIYLSPGQHEEIAALAAKRRVSKSSVIEAAIASLLSPDSADMREAAFVRRLDRHTRQIERVERDLAIAIETIALFVRFWLAVTPPLPERAQAAAKAKGAERYRDFVETLGRRLQRGNSLVREISLEIWPEQSSNSLGTAVPTDLDPGAGEIADGR